MTRCPINKSNNLPFPVSSVFKKPPHSICTSLDFPLFLPLFFLSPNSTITFSSNVDDPSCLCTGCLSSCILLKTSSFSHLTKNSAPIQNAQFFPGWLVDISSQSSFRNSTCIFPAVFLYQFRLNFSSKQWPLFDFTWNRFSLICEVSSSYFVSLSLLSFIQFLNISFSFSYFPKIKTSSPFPSKFLRSICLFL